MSSGPQEDEYRGQIAELLLNGFVWDHDEDNFDYWHKVYQLFKPYWVRPDSREMNRRNLIGTLEEIHRLLTRINGHMTLVEYRLFEYIDLRLARLS